VTNFLTTSAFSRAELEELIDTALLFKCREVAEKPLAGQSVALVFFNPSLRTRASMQVGVYELGGNAVVLEPGATSWTLEHREGIVMDGDKTEHLKEFVRVLERYVLAIGVRTFAELKNWEEERRDPVLSAFERYATKPLINLESAMHHPCQALADMMAIRDRFGPAKKKVLLTWAWHPKPLPMAVPNSFALAAAQMGHDLRITHPKGYELDGELMDEVRRFAGENGGSVEITNDVNESFDDVEVVYAKSWGSYRHYGNPEQEVGERAAYRAVWIVDRQKMERTKDAAFMHCLPVRRNVIVTDEVIDGSNSLVIDEGREPAACSEGRDGKIIEMIGEKLDLLREALPYIQKFKGKTFVVKFSGKVTEDSENLASLAQELALLHQVGIRICVVHGGGKQLTQLAEKMGVAQTVINGRRITDDETLELAKMIFAGKINTEILAALRNHGIEAVGLSGVDGNIVHAVRRPPKEVLNRETGERKEVDFGHVGDVIEINARLLDVLLNQDYLPVVSSLGADDDGQIYNINADTIAAEIAISLQAEKLVLLSDVSGIYLERDKPETQVSRLSVADAADHIASGKALGGMIPKLQNITQVIKSGVGSVHVISGTTRNALLSEVFTDSGTGTMITG
jgi:acetylglutamate kinase